MHELYELKEMLCDKLKEYGKKQDITGQALEIVDKLAHSIKNIEKIIESEETGGQSRGRSYRGTYEGSYHDGMNGSYSGRRNVMRDAMGRYSGTEDMIAELRALMQSAPDEKTRQEFSAFIKRIEAM